MRGSLSLPRDACGRRPDLLHTLAHALLALPSLAAMAALRLLVSPRLHRAIARRIRRHAVAEMERNLALFDAASPARRPDR